MFFCWDRCVSQFLLMQHIFSHSQLTHRSISMLPFCLVFVPVAELPRTCWCRTGLLLECSIESSKAVCWGKVCRQSMSRVDVRFRQFQDLADGATRPFKQCPDTLSHRLFVYIRILNTWHFVDILMTWESHGRFCERHGTSKRKRWRLVLPMASQCSWHDHLSVFCKKRTKRQVEDL